jgi:nitrogen-specific signal transduction histidine kinase
LQSRVGQLFENKRPATRSTQTGAVEVPVKDCGAGIQTTEQSRVFQPFYTTKSQGLGLGLTMCSTIVQAHDGNPTLANGDDGGAVATLGLPAQEEIVTKLSRETLRPEEVDPGGTGRKRRASPLTTPSGWPRAKKAPAGGRGA